MMRNFQITLLTFSLFLFLQTDAIMNGQSMSTAMDCKVNCLDKSGTFCK